MPTEERYAKTNLNNSPQNELYVSRAGDVVTEYSTPTILKNSYVQGTGVDSKYTRIPASGDAGRRHFLGDSVGTVSVTVTETAAISESTLKDVWGVAFPGPTSSERYGYAQREQDYESGLVHMRARQYDPRLGRFTQTDPLFGSRTTEHFTYAFGNPVSHSDPLGLYGWDDLIRDATRIGQQVFIALPSPAKNLAVQTLVGYTEVVAGTQPPGGFAMPEGKGGYTGRILGRALGGLQGVAEIVGGGATAVESVEGGAALALASGGSASGPAAAVAITGVTAGMALAGLGVYHVKNLWDLGARGDAPGNPGGEKPDRPRTPEENQKARDYFKNHKEEARQAWEKREGKTWPTDSEGNPWPAEHTPALKEGGDPMIVYPRDPKTDPHSIPGPDGKTDYQKWGAQGTPAREAKKSANQ